MVTLFHKLVELDWVTVALFPVTVILMEVFWVYPWLVWMGERPTLVWHRLPLSLASVILLPSISFFVTRFFLGRRWSLPWIRLSIVFCGLVAIFVVVYVEYSTGFRLPDRQWFANITQVLLDSFSHPHPIVIAMTGGVYLWWRGIRRGCSSLYFDDIYRSFLVGLFALVVLIIIWRTTAVGLHVAGFFFFGLTALALANLRNTQDQIREKEGVASVLGRHRLSVIVVVVGGIVLVGISITSIFSPEFVALLGRFLNLARDLLSEALYYLLIPIAYLGAGLVYMLQFIINWLLRDPHEPPSLIEDPAHVDVLPESASRVFPPEAILAIKWAIFALVVMTVIFLLAKAISRYWSFKAKDEIEEVHESLWSWQGFKADLWLFFSSLWQKFRSGRIQPVQVTAIPTWYDEEDTPGSLSIREIYRHLLWEAASSGIAHSSHETVYEYAKRLERAVPDGGEQLAQLTDLYVDVRYGELETQVKQIDQANVIWSALRRLIRRLRGEQEAA